MSDVARPQVAFVTGATGLLGSNLTEMLTRRGDTVRALVRSEARGRTLLRHTPAELVVGDLEDVSSFARHLEGVDVLYHTAAYFRDTYKGGKHTDVLMRVNVEGTRKLLQVAYDRGVRRAVHTSSMAVLRARPSAAATDETMLRSVADAPDEYYRSKILADAEVMAALDAHPELWACFVLPGFMSGPGDAGPTPAGQLVLDFVTGKLPGALDIGFSFVDARDVAATLIAAADRGRRGERYLAAGTPYSIKQALCLLAEVTGRPKPTRVFPNWLFAVAALGSEVWHRMTGKPVLTSWTGFRTVMSEQANLRFDNSKAMTELGVSFRPLQESLLDTVRWYEAHGRLPPNTASVQPGVA